MNLEAVIEERKRKAQEKRARRFRPADPPASYEDERAKRKQIARAKDRAREEIYDLRIKHRREVVASKGKTAHFPGDGNK